MSIAIIIQTLINSLQYASILALSAFAIILIFKTSTTTNFAQGTISVFGAHITAFMFTRLGIPLGFGIVAGVAIGFLMGWFVDTKILRAAKVITPVGKQIVTMGIVLFLTGLIPVVFGLIPLNLPTLVNGNLLVNVNGTTFVMTYHSLITTVFALITLTTLFLALKFTKWGLGVRATASNEMVAGMMGVNTRLITALSWGIAGGLGATAAILYGATIGFSAGYMTGVQVNGFLAAVLGGFSTFFGPVIGSLMITIGGNLIGYEFSVWKDVLVYTLILIVIFIKPIGLFGKKTIKKV